MNLNVPPGQWDGDGWLHLRVVSVAPGDQPRWMWVRGWRGGDPGPELVWVQVRAEALPEVGAS